MTIRNTKNATVWFKKGIFSIIIVAALILCIHAADTAAKAAESEAGHGILKQETDAGSNLVTIKLVGVSQYEVTELFNDLLTGIPGVKEAKRYRLRIDPDKPHASLVEWQVRTEDIDLFQLESHLYGMIRSVAHEDRDVTATDFTFIPTEEALELLKQIIPWRASSSEIEFVLYGPTTPASKGPRGGCDARGIWRHWPDSGFE